MRTDFDLIVRNEVSVGEIAAALASANGIGIGEVDVQDMDDVQPITDGVKIWCCVHTVEGEFSTRLSIYLRDPDLDFDFVRNACKVSKFLGSECLTPDDDSPVYSSMMLINGLNTPLKVELIEDVAFREVQYTLAKKRPGNA